MSQVYMQNVLDYIEKHLGDDSALNNAVLANIAGYSEYHFLRLFRDTVGHTPADYIRKRRLSEIAKRIVCTDKPISEIAFAFGFNSKENFTRAFKNEHGILPTAFRGANCSLRLFEPFSFETQFAFPAVSLQNLKPFVLVAYPFADGFAPHCWNVYNAERRSATLSGGGITADYGAMRWNPVTNKLDYYIGMPETHAHGNRDGTVELTVEGGLYAVFETSPRDQHTFVDTVRKTWDWIGEHWLPSSGFCRRDAFELECYTESQRTYTETIYIPIRSQSMAEIIKTFKEDIPPLRFIGKKYAEFGHWGEWWQNDWFGTLERAMGGTDKILAIWQNGGGYVGLEHWTPNAPFAYWLGMFAPIDTPVPEGFEYVDFTDVALGTCWIYGAEQEVHDTSACVPALLQNGMTVRKDADGGTWSFENCLCPRYTNPDEQGKIILDYCVFVEK